MSSSDSISSESSFEPPPIAAATRRPCPPDRVPPRAPSGTSSNRPLPDLPHHSDSGHSGDVLSALLRDRPLPNPMEQTADHRRRSLIALDRKRRLTNPDYGDPRRRSNNTNFPERNIAQDTQRTDAAASSSARSRASSTTVVPPQIIDLTGSSPPLHEDAAQDTRLVRTPSENTRQALGPRWQPDSEVNNCPICHRPFTWMFRRHHCRKCGRVVCNECSPHRITIPRQYIIHPPTLEFATSPTSRHVNSIDLTQDDDENLRSPSSPGLYGVSGRQLEGGEKVRLCNPCVPDPQPEPPLYYSAGSDGTSRDSRWNGGLAQGFNSNHTGRPGHRQTVSHSGAFEGRNATGPRGDQLRQQGQGRRAGRYSGYGSLENSNSGPGWFGSVVGLSSPARFRPGGSDGSVVPKQQPDNSQYTPQSVSPSLVAVRPTYPGNQQPRGEYTSTASSMPNRSRGISLLDENNLSGRSERPRPSQNPFVMNTRPRLAESDVCPVCRRALPPQGPNGDESAREAHIIDCLMARDATYHGEGSPGGPFQARIHMLPFIATEKDCVGQDGSNQECSICMVEYDVGDELARLECLCKFHKECIVEWFGRKAECPLHKLMS